MTLRAPRIGDAVQWRAARLANRRWLEPLFPADAEDWADGQGRAQWTERCLRLRAAARTARAFPYVLLLNGRLVGEIGVDAGLCWIGDPCYVLHANPPPSTVGRTWDEFPRAAEAVPA